MITDSPGEGRVRALGDSASSTRSRPGTRRRAVTAYGTGRWGAVLAPGVLGRSTGPRGRCPACICKDPTPLCPAGQGIVQAGHYDLTVVKQSVHRVRPGKRVRCCPVSAVGRETPPLRPRQPTRPAAPREADRPTGPACARSWSRWKAGRSSRLRPVGACGRAGIDTTACPASSPPGRRSATTPATPGSWSSRLTGHATVSPRPTSPPWGPWRYSGAADTMTGRITSTNPRIGRRVGLDAVCRAERSCCPRSTIAAPHPAHPEVRAARGRWRCGPLSARRGLLTGVGAR
jgi:hypothetical protein